MEKRVAIVTGASSGIGAALVRLLAGNYSGLVLQARKAADSLEKVASEARLRGTEVVTVLGNLTDEDFGQRLVDQALKSFGRLDCVVANAGFPILKSLNEGTYEDLEYAFKGNTLSFFSLVKAASPALVESPAGRIVAIGSFTSHVFRVGIRNFPISAASKGALEVATKGIALELAPSGVTVNCVIPGAIQKDHLEDSVSDEELAEMARNIPLGRAGTSGDVAEAVEFLLSARASYITGQALHVNGGLHI